MSLTADHLEQHLRTSGLLSEGVAVAVACTSPATGPLTWATGSCRGRPADERTPFYVASVTKQLVGVLLAQLVLEGLLDPEESIATFVPRLPAWSAPVRVSHLVHHTAGLPPAPWLLGIGVADRDLTNTSVVEALRGRSGPDRPPGRVHAYSNVGYVLLAEVLVAVTGTAVPALAQQRLFEPLGLTDCRLGDVPAGTPVKSQPPATIGDGGWWTSATNLLSWLDGLNRGVLGEDVSRLVQTPGRLDDGTPLDYGWGVTVRPGAPGTTFTHGGNWPGWAAKTVRQPATGTAVALLSTSDDTLRVSDTAVELHERLLDGGGGSATPEP